MNEYFGLGASVMVVLGAVGSIYKWVVVPKVENTLLQHAKEMKIECDRKHAGISEHENVQNTAYQELHNTIIEHSTALKAISETTKMTHSLILTLIQKD